MLFRSNVRRGSKTYSRDMIQRPILRRGSVYSNIFHRTMTKTAVFKVLWSSVSPLRAELNPCTNAVETTYS